MADIFVKHGGRILDQIRAGICASGMTGRGVVAVSGGADSVALLVGLHLLQEAGLSFSVAHLNHGLRGSESDQDAEFVKHLAAELGLPCDEEKIDVAASASFKGLGLEEGARAARLEFFKRVAVARQANWVATAHHLDDQAETLLHHLVRGTGLAGLRGIPRRRELAPGIDLVRPLLDISRDSLREGLAEWGQGYRLDSSNDSVEFTRNRIRHQLLPLLRDKFNPRVAESLGRLAGQAAEWEEFLNRSVEEFLSLVLLDESEAGYRLKRSEWLSQPVLVQQGAFHELWKRRHWPRQNMSAAHWKRGLETIRAGGKQEFPGRVQLEVRDDLIRIHRVEER